MGDKLHGKAGQIVTNVGEKWAAKDVEKKRSAAERAWRNRNWTTPVVPAESFLAGDAGAAGSFADAGASCAGTSGCGD